MTQRRRHSFLEACLNTASGFTISYLAWPLVCRFVLHVPFHPGRGLEVILVFTVLSICRNYAWRRLFNRPRPMRGFALVAEQRDLQKLGLSGPGYRPIGPRRMAKPPPAAP